MNQIKSKNLKKVILNVLFYFLFILIIIVIVSGIDKWILKENSAFFNINGARIKVNIFNASGIDKAGNDVGDHLRNLGFDIIDVDNYFKILENTILISREKEKANAKKVARAIKYKGEIITEIQENYPSQVTIILGKDILEYKIFELIK